MPTGPVTATKTLDQGRPRRQFGEQHSAVDIHARLHGLGGNHDSTRPRRRLPQSRFDRAPLMRPEPGMQQQPIQRFVPFPQLLVQPLGPFHAIEDH